MKAVMKSVSPRICEKVANGDCTILVSKTAPKCGAPFKDYICVAKGKPYLYRVDDDDNFELTNTLRPKVYEYVKDYNEQNGKVIGEFICDKVYEWECKIWLELVGELGLPNWRASYMIFVDDLEKTCLTYDDLWECGKGKTLHGLHISDLKIYDKPKELSEFRKPCKINPRICDRCEYYSTWSGRCENITRAPQSYMYVEE